VLFEILFKTAYSLPMAEVKTTGLLAAKKTAFPFVIPNGKAKSFPNFSFRKSMLFVIVGFSAILVCIDLLLENDLNGYGLITIIILVVVGIVDVVGGVLAIRSESSLKSTRICERVWNLCTSIFQPSCRIRIQIKQ
jgi:hypothetical protein